jgi:hypothetical protein
VLIFFKASSTAGGLLLSNATTAGTTTYSLPLKANHKSAIYRHRRHVVML